MTTHHRHHPGKYTYALVLAKLLLDDQAEQIIADRIGDCWQCWKHITDTLVTEVWSNLLARHGMPTMHPSGVIEGRALDVVYGIQQGMLDAVEADERHDDDAA